jgi:anti-sigma factor RsiW
VTMDCGQARRLLWPDAGPRVATAEIVAAREHAAGCEACRGFLQDMQSIGEQIARNAPRPPAPTEVRDRLFKSIARARTASQPQGYTTRRGRMAIAGAGAFLVLVLGLLVYLRLPAGSPGSDPALGSIAEDRLRSQKGAVLVSADSLQVARWLVERLPFAVQVPLFPDARLTGARLLVDRRKSGAVIEYTTQGRLLTYYVLPGGTGSPRRVRLTSRDGYRVASWHDAGLTHALVGTLPPARLIEYASYCIHQMMAALYRSRRDAATPEIPVGMRDGCHACRAVPRGA